MKTIEVHFSAFGISRWRVGNAVECRRTLSMQVPDSLGVSLSKFVIRVGFIVPLGADLSMKPFGECSF